MDEREREQIRAQYFKRAVREIAEGSLDTAARAIEAVKQYSGTAPAKGDDRGH